MNGFTASFVVFLAAALPATFVAGATLIGATGELVAPCHNTIVNIDTTNAHMNVLNATFDTCPWHVNSAALSKKKGLFFVLRRHGHNSAPLYITKYNATTGEFVSDVELSNNSISSLYSVFFDEDLQVLVCIVLDRKTGYWLCATIDPENGAIQEKMALHTLAKVEAFEMAFSGYDMPNKMFHQMIDSEGVQTLLSIDIKSPKKSEKKEFKNTSPNNFLISPSFLDGKLVGFLNNLTLTSFDLNTGEINPYGDQLMNVGENQFLISSWHSVIDTETGLLYITCTLNPMTADKKTVFYALNVGSGKIQFQKEVAAPVMFLHLL